MSSYVSNCGAARIERAESGIRGGWLWRLFIGGQLVEETSTLRSAKRCAVVCLKRDVEWRRR